MTQEPLPILLLGYGLMGTALAQALLGSNIVVSLTLAEPDASSMRRRLSSVEYISVNVHADSLVSAEHDVVIRAVRRQDTCIALAEAASFLPNALIVLLIGGISMDVVSRAVPAGQLVARAKPNLPATVQRRMNFGYAAVHKTSTNDRLGIEVVFSAAGSLHWLAAKDALKAVTDVADRRENYFFDLIESLQRAGDALGSSLEDAWLLPFETVISRTPSIKRGSMIYRGYQNLRRRSVVTTATCRVELEKRRLYPKHRSGQPLRQQIEPIK